MKRCIVLILFLIVGSSANWNLSFDADARYHMTDFKQHDGGLHVAGLQVRKVVSDAAGDRLFFSVLGEAHDNFKEWMLHECYVRYKGPLGKWNVSAGRMGLPFGLLSSFSTDRLLYAMLPEYVVGFDVDNGVMVSGVTGRFDYAVSFTQGYGGHLYPGFPGHGFGTARIGFSAGYTEEFLYGISLMGGKTAYRDTPNQAVRRIGGGGDATMYLGQFLIRAEITGGRIDTALFAAGFAAVDYALYPKADLTLSGLVMHKTQIINETVFTGVTIRPRWFTVRGGYHYAFHGNNHHKISLQVYRAIPFTF